MGGRTIGPASSGLGEGLARRDVLVPSRSSDSFGRPGACTLTQSPGVRCILRHIGVAGFCVKKQCGLVGSWFGGRTALDIRLSSPYGSCSGETRLTTNWIPLNWVEKGVKKSLTVQAKKRHIRMIIKS